MENKNNQKNDKNTPGYIIGLWVARILWFFIIFCLLAVGVALAASVVKLLMWYWALLFL